MQTSEPKHWLCQPCFENAKKSVLQGKGHPAKGRGRFWACNSCGTDILVGARRYAGARGIIWDYRTCSEPYLTEDGERLTLPPVYRLALLPCSAYRKL